MVVSQLFGDQPSRSVDYLRMQWFGQRTACWKLSATCGKL